MTILIWLALILPVFIYLSLTIWDLNDRVTFLEKHHGDALFDLQRKVNDAYPLQVDNE